jgi:hypothetical protein
MNLDHIFNSFNESYDPSSLDNDMSLLIDFSEHPFYWIGGFNKVISNRIYFKQYTLKMFKTSSEVLDDEKIEQIGNNLMFNKAWEYIRDINLNNPFHLECISKKSDNVFLGHIKQSISYFEKLEEYEKCDILKKIELKIKESLI